MSSHPVAHPDTSTSHRRVAAVVLATAIVAIAIASGAVMALRSNDSAESISSPGVQAPQNPLPAVTPDALPARPIRQLVVVSAQDDIRWASSLPGIDVPGYVTDFLVVNDEQSQNILAGIESFMLVPGVEPMVIIDLR